MVPIPRFIPIHDLHLYIVQCNLSFAPVGYMLNSSPQCNPLQLLPTPVPCPIHTGPYFTPVHDHFRRSAVIAVHVPFQSKRHFSSLQYTFHGNATLRSTVLSSMYSSAESIPVQCPWFISVQFLLHYMIYHSLWSTPDYGPFRLTVQSSLWSTLVQWFTSINLLWSVVYFCPHTNSQFTPVHWYIWLQFPRFHCERFSLQSTLICNPLLSTLVSWIIIVVKIQVHHSLFRVGSIFVTLKSLIFKKTHPHN